MDILEAKINQLVVENSDESKTFVRTFSTRPDKNLMEKVGKIFGLIEIESTNSQIPNLIDLIIDEIKNNYYHDKLTATSEVLNLNEHFEAALKKTNIAISSFLEIEQIDLNLEKINILIAVICHQEIYFTVIGNVGVILFYHLAPNNYRIINALEIAHSPITTPDPLKIFSQIISGKIKPRDVLFIATANTFDYFSWERIKNIVAEQLPAEGIIQLKQLLSQTNNNENFGALAIELEKISTPIKKEVTIQEFNYRQAASKDSIKELIRTEKETEKLLTPSILPEIKKYATSLKTAFQNYLNKTKTTTSTFYQKQKKIIKRPNINLPRPNLPKLKIGTNVSGIGKSQINQLKKIIVTSRLNIKKIYTPIFNQPIWHKLNLIIQQIFGKLFFKFKKLPKSSKILLVLTIILGIWFTQSIIWLQIKNRQVKKTEQFNQIIVETENKKNEAEASLIYRNENQARQLLIEAKNLLANLKPDSKAQTDQINLLLTEIEEQLQKLRHVVEITDPVQIVNFQNLDGQASIASLAVNTQSTLYTQNHRNQSIYKANLDTRVMSAIFSPNANTGNLKLGIAINNNELVFFNDSMSAFALNPTNDTIKSITINITDNTDITDVTTYNNRIYLLDRVNSQIYRYSKNDSGYGNINNWLSESVDLSNATALTIDGSIYVLKNNGEIIKFQNGKVVDWQANLIDPKLDSPTKIKTTEKSKYLYVLDPPTKRLVVIDKEGNLINQYTSDNFNDLKDFIVIEERKEIYILAGSTVFGIPAQHLK